MIIVELDSCIKSDLWVIHMEIDEDLFKRAANAQ